MKITIFAVLLSAVQAFVPSTTPFGVVSRDVVSTALNAKHVENKAARKAAANRPKKSRPSDINRKPTSYPTFEKPAEYTISDKPASPASKPSA